MSATVSQDDADNKLCISVVGQVTWFLIETEFFCLTSMSDKEDSLPGEGTAWEDSQSPDVGGAYGGGEPERSLTPQSDSVDNISMEVQFEEMSSRHPSEISSLSYQNMLEDGEGSGIILSRHESEDSNDSFPPDFGESFPHEDLEISTRMKDLPTEITEKYKDNFEKKLTKGDLEKENEQLSKEKLRELTGFQKDAKLGLEIESQKSHIVPKPLQEQQDNNCYQQSTKEQVHDLKEITKKRNSLEVRNNIPVVGEVKNYEKDVTNLTYSNQGAKPKIRKQSPGLACRVSDGSGGSGSDREGSSSEREIDKPTKMSSVKPSNLIQPTCISGSHLEKEDNNQENFTSNKIIAENLENLNQNGGDILGRRNEYIENEYDYVKYARIQDGNSYVGMRLAYSSTEETKHNSLGINGLGNNVLDISREGSPEKNLHPKRELSSQIPLQQVNEDTLTEIPLNNNNGDIVLNDENKAFSLSPENTECDSVEVESVLSDGEKSNIGMPMVEDGLSSSQGSDVEDNVPNPVHSSPTLMLRKKQKAEVEQEMLNLESPDKPKEIDAQAIMEDLKAKREALDLAISDIKSAIQKSKGISLQSPYKEESENSEPVWVMREPYNGKVQRKEETERLREEINRLQDEDVCREHDKVYQMESEKDRLLENQFTRNDGKSYQPPRGYDSDDEEDKDVKYTKRLRGKKYASLPIDDSYDHRHSVNGSNCVHRHHDVKLSRSDSDSIEYSYTVENQHNSDTLCSDSEEYGSDGEAPSKTAYLKQRTEGDFDTDEETDILLQKQYQKDQYVDIPELTNPPVNRSVQAEKRRSRAKEVSISDPNNPTVLIEGVLFRAKYLGSTQLISEGQPSKAMRMMQAQEAVGRIKREREKLNNVVDQNLKKFIKI
ncbi:hypothetical protein KUTeg_017905 [Tegillarca granosa]|uniref:PID domain-containing protein n=1 Tax=Tegillarca granosa TaxID=220873 RepID=A0ABQ9EK58_TEGGR|nr:hypothetical protein KUTeg_017905 [Tegillarca granosa]